MRAYARTLCATVGAEFVWLLIEHLFQDALVTLILTLLVLLAQP